MPFDTLPAAQAVEALITAYGRLVFQVIYGLSGDWHESEDLTQETFISAFRAIDAARATRCADFHAKAWLLRIAVNLVRMQRRRQRVVRVIPFASLREEEQGATEYWRIEEQAAPVQPVGYGAGTGQEDPADLIAERDAVQRTLSQLPETLRFCLLLSIVGGLSSFQIARTLGLSEAAVRQRLSRAKRQFQKRYRLESWETLLPISAGTEPGAAPPCGVQGSASSPRTSVAGMCYTM